MPRKPKKVKPHPIPFKFRKRFVQAKKPNKPGVKLTTANRENAKMDRISGGPKITIIDHPGKFILLKGRYRGRTLERIATFDDGLGYLNAVAISQHHVDPVVRQKIIAYLDLIQMENYRQIAVDRAMQNR